MSETDVEKAEVRNTFSTSVFTIESLENIPHLRQDSTTRC